MYNYSTTVFLIKLCSEMPEPTYTTYGSPVALRCNTENKESYPNLYIFSSVIAVRKRKGNYTNFDMVVIK